MFIVLIVFMSLSCCAAETSKGSQRIFFSYQRPGFTRGASRDINVPSRTPWKPQQVKDQVHDQGAFYYVVDQPYNQHALDLFDALAQKNTPEEVQKFWKDFSDKSKNEGIFKIVFGMSPKKRAEVRDSLLNLIYSAGAQVLLGGFEHRVEFKQNGEVIYSVSIDQDKVDAFRKFDVIDRMWESLGVSGLIPILLDDMVDITDIDRCFKLLLQFVFLVQKRLAKFARSPNYPELTKEVVQRTTDTIFFNASTDVFNNPDLKDVSLELLQQVLVLANYLELQEPFIGYVINVYVDRLITTKFASQDEILKVLPSNFDLDVRVVQALMQKILTQTYYYARKGQEQEVLAYRPVGTGSPVPRGREIKLILHEGVPIPVFFVRTTVESNVLHDSATKNQDERLSNYYGVLDKDVLDIEFYDPISAVLITKDGLQLLSVTKEGYYGTREVKAAHELPAKNIADGFVRLIDQRKMPFKKESLSDSQHRLLERPLQHFFVRRQPTLSTMCAGFGNYIAVFSVYNDKIFHFKSYMLPELLAKSVVSDLFVLDNVIAVSCKQPSGEYEYAFFDVERTGFLEKTPHNALEVRILTHSNVVVGPNVNKKVAILMRDNDLCINRAMIMKARGFTKLYDCKDMLIDDAQEHIYVAENSVTVKKYSIIPSGLKRIINHINQTEKTLRGKQQRSSLTLDLLYYMSWLQSTYTPAEKQQAPQLNLIEAEKQILQMGAHISPPMKNLVEPSVRGKAQSAYFSLSDAFKNKLKWFASAVGMTGLAWLWQKSGRTGVAPTAPVKQPSAMTGKLWQ